MENRMTHTVKFYNANGWHTFEEYGMDYRDESVRVAQKLAALFPIVEIHSYYPWNDETLTERIHRYE